MGKIAFLFPGQGAQSVGMGRDLFGADEFTDGLAEAASVESGTDLSRVCVKGPSNRLDNTAFLQPALTTVCLGLWKKLTDAGIVPDVVAGHSVGEISSLAATYAVSPFEAVHLASVRGRSMADAAEKKPGKMTAVTGLELSAINEVLAQATCDGVLAVAAVNAAAQAVLSGDPLCVDIASEKLKEKGATGITQLRVSGAWHSEHMRVAMPPLLEALRSLKMKSPSIPMIFNRNGGESHDPRTIADLIAGQLVSPVRWDLVMTRTHAMGITEYIEIGPGKVLRGLIRLNLPAEGIRVHNVSDMKSLERTLSQVYR